MSGRVVQFGEAPIVFEFLQEDRPLDGELRNVSSAIRERAWPLYD